MYAGVPLRLVRGRSPEEWRMERPKSVALRGESGAEVRKRKLSSLTSR